MKRLLQFLGTCTLAACVTSAAAEVRIENAQYHKGGTSFKTVLAYDTAFQGRRPPMHGKLPSSCGRLAPKDAILAPG